jgi:hypothetical protein
VLPRRAAGGHARAVGAGPRDHDVGVTGSHQGRISWGVGGV